MWRWAAILDFKMATIYSHKSTKNTPVDVVTRLFLHAFRSWSNLIEYALNNSCCFYIYQLYTQTKPQSHLTLHLFWLDNIFIVYDSILKFKLPQQPLQNILHVKEVYSLKFCVYCVLIRDIIWHMISKCFCVLTWNVFGLL